VFTAYRMEYDPFLRSTAGISHFPFEPLGAAALAILFLMAATSHDFWLAVLGASWWKRLHLLVIVAYGLLVLHVALGVLQTERHPLPAALLLAGMAAVLGLHLAAARREAAADSAAARLAGDGFVRGCRFGELVEGRGKVVWNGRERVAVWLHRQRVYATANVCRHQGGPLGEGRVLDGCITCPWHGWQYRPEDGQSPPPFEERVETYRVRVHEGDVWLDPRPAPPGTPQPGGDASQGDAR
jgi:sulfoxide reductase heme-binding subunit YedZ